MPLSAKLRLLTLSLPTQLPDPALQFQIRLASTAANASMNANCESDEAAGTPSNPFPFPRHRNPTPHQIFHLNAGANQAEIKARYYDLVRHHHPDSHNARFLPPKTRHSNFQSITAAYDVLRGKRPAHHLHSSHLYGGYWSYEDELERRRRYMWANKRNRERAKEYYDKEWRESGWRAEHAVEDAWRERVMVIVGALSLGIGLISVMTNMSIVDQRHLAASASLAQARNDAKLYGVERRQAIRRVLEEERQKEREIKGETCLGGVR